MRAWVIVAAPSLSLAGPATADGGAAPTAAAAVAPARPDLPWKIELERRDLRIESRRQPGEALVEVRAVGTIHASPAVVEAVVDDHGAYAEFMPSVSLSRVLMRDADGRRLLHQVLAFPLVSRRDYVVWLEDESRGSGTARVYRARWRTAVGAGPAPEPDVVRMPRADGYWQVEAGVAPDEARVTYRCFTDPGGALPAWLVNTVNRSAIEAVFGAVETRARALASRR